MEWKRGGPGESRSNRSGAVETRRGEAAEWSGEEVRRRFEGRVGASAVESRGRVEASELRRLWLEWPDLSLA